MIGDQRLGVGGVEFQQRHRALAGQPRHQPRPGGDHLQSFGHGERAGHHRGGDLAHRMSDHGVGFHAVGAPQRGQRQLHPDQHRLDALDADDRLPRRPAPRVAKTRPAQQKPAPARRSRRRTPARRPAAVGPSRPIASPARSRRTPCPARTARRGGPPPPPPGWPAASARNPATASARSRAHTVANLGCRAR